MGQRVKVELYDDFDPEQPADRTATFGWEGKTYEIDLASKNYAKLEKALAEFVSHARIVGRTGSTRKLHSVKTGPDPRAVRAWAAANGIEVNRLGKVPQPIVDQFVAAGN